MHTRAALDQRRRLYVRSSLLPAIASEPSHQPAEAQGLARQLRAKPASPVRASRDPQNPTCRTHASTRAVTCAAPCKNRADRHVLTRTSEPGPPAGGRRHVQLTHIPVTYVRYLDMLPRHRGTLAPAASANMPARHAAGGCQSARTASRQPRAPRLIKPVLQLQRCARQRCSRRQASTWCRDTDSNRWFMWPLPVGIAPRRLPARQWQRTRSGRADRGRCAATAVRKRLHSACAWQRRLTTCPLLLRRWP